MRLIWRGWRELPSWWPGSIGHDHAGQGLGAECDGPAAPAAPRRGATVASTAPSATATQQGDAAQDAREHWEHAHSVS